ncbi:hypothetical protein ABTX61_21380 [Amycolatopsis japonica]
MPKKSSTAIANSRRLPSANGQAAALVRKILAVAIGIIDRTVEIPR